MKTDIQAIICCKEAVTIRIPFNFLAFFMGAIVYIMTIFVYFSPPSFLLTEVSFQYYKQVAVRRAVMRAVRAVRAANKQYIKKDKAVSNYLILYSHIYQFIICIDSVS